MDSFSSCFAQDAYTPFATNSAHSLSVQSHNHPISTDPAISTPSHDLLLPECNDGHLLLDNGSIPDLNFDDIDTQTFTELQRLDWGFVDRVDNDCLFSSLSPSPPSSPDRCRTIFEQPNTPHPSQDYRPLIEELYDEIDVKRACGQCGLVCAQKSVSMKVTGVRVRRDIDHLCGNHVKHNFQWTSASKYSTDQPSTNVPVNCTLCEPIRSGRSVQYPTWWKYSLFIHIRDEHPNYWSKERKQPQHIPDRLAKELIISQQECDAILRDFEVNSSQVLVQFPFDNTSWDSLTRPPQTAIALPQPKQRRR